MTDVDALLDHALARLHARDLREPLYVTQDEWDALRERVRDHDPERRFDPSFGAVPQGVNLFSLRVVVDPEKAAQR